MKKVQSEAINWLILYKLSSLMFMLTFRTSSTSSESIPKPPPPLLPLGAKPLLCSAGEEVMSEAVSAFINKLVETSSRVARAAGGGDAIEESASDRVAEKSTLLCESVLGCSLILAVDDE